MGCILIQYCDSFLRRIVGDRKEMRDVPKICGDGEKKHLEILHVVNKWAIGGVERFIEDLIDECTNPDINQSVLSICTPIDSRIKDYGDRKSVV